MNLHLKRHFQYKRWFCRWICVFSEFGERFKRQFVCFGSSLNWNECTHICSGKIGFAYSTKKKKMMNQNQKRKKKKWWWQSGRGCRGQKLWPEVQNVSRKKKRKNTEYVKNGYGVRRKPVICRKQNLQSTKWPDALFGAQMIWPLCSCCSVLADGLCDQLYARTKEQTRDDETLRRKT